SVISERKEPKIVIAPTGTLKPPKIIIKPTNNVVRNRDRTIPKVSAIPSPEIKGDRMIVFQPQALGAEERMEKPPLK
ncbi:hypothetical protein Q0O91_14120, partial [Staphylococcus aureus]|nr:hypothetical protein [Staphylococcus aureus]